jgi:hypothetical protein
MGPEYERPTSDPDATLLDVLQEVGTVCVDTFVTQQTSYID